MIDSVRPQDAEKNLSQCHFAHSKYHTAYLGGPNLRLIYYCIKYYITFIISYLLDLVAWDKSLKWIFYQSKVTIRKQVE
jgi:hypothetical protein